LIEGTIVRSIVSVSGIGKIIAASDPNAGIRTRHGNEKQATRHQCN
jgi:hypothetical protein